MSSGGRKQQYFIPGDGIVREVIQADVCKYLDNDATVRPGNFNGRDGYFIYAYRNFTNEMVADLRNDSAKWLREKQEMKRAQPSPRGAPAGKSSGRGSSGRAPEPYVEPRYKDSNTYERSELRAQARRDADSSDTPVPQGYSGHGPPPVSYGEVPMSDYGSQYTTHSPPQQGYGSHGNYQNPPYQPLPDQQYPRGTGPPTGYNIPAGYPNPGYQPVPDQQYPRTGPEPPQANTSRPYQPGFPQVQAQSRETYGYDPRQDPNYDPRQDPNYDPRQDPNYDPRQDPSYDPRQDPNFGQRTETRNDNPQYQQEPSAGKDKYNGLQPGYIWIS